MEPLARLVRRIVKLVAATLAFVTYVWFAAVRAAPAVKRRKARRDAALGRPPLRRPGR